MSLMFVYKKFFLSSASRSDGLMFIDCALNWCHWANKCFRSAINSSTSSACHVPLSIVYFSWLIDWASSNKCFTCYFTIIEHEQVVIVKFTKPANCLTIYVLAIGCKRRVAPPKRINFRKSSKRPLTPPPSFSENHVANVFANFRLQNLQHKSFH